MKWAHFLHVYQPPYQKIPIIKKVSEESYQKLFKGLLEIEGAKITLNINGVLCELLEKHGGADILKDLKTLVERGSVELTGSAKFHAFLPLLSELEIEHQIISNEKTLTHYFGSSWKKGGFFSPEMAYSKKVAQAAAKLGYTWIIIDEYGFPGLKKVNYNTVYTIKDVPGIKAFFRERNLSHVFMSSEHDAVPTLLRYVDKRIEGNGYAVTAMDGEMFGHHRPGFENFLFDLLRQKHVQYTSMTDLIGQYPEEEIEPQDSTWAVTRSDLKKGSSFTRWLEPENPIHVAQWKLSNLAVEITERDPQNSEIRSLLDPALHSCQYWWASARPWWSIEMIERGAYGLREVVLKAPVSTPEEKALAEELYKIILYTSFDWQRSGYVDEVAKRENEEVNERLEEKQKIFITKAEYEQMIFRIKLQIKLAVSNEEFQQAAMMKDRVKVLTEEMKKATV